MPAARRPKTRQGGDAQVLHVALAPATLATEKIDEVRRHLLPGAAHLRQEADLPAGPAQERALDDVVAQDLAAERCLAGQHRQFGIVGEGRDPQDRVVSPIASIRALPGLEAADRQRRVEPHGELLDTGKQRVPAGRVGDGLDQPDLGRLLHQPGEAAHGGAGHQTVGVEHDHEIVFRAVGLAELGDVTGLAARIVLAPPVAEARQARAVQTRPCLDPGEFMLLHRRDGTVTRVGEDEDVDIGPVAAATLKRAGHDTQRGEHRHRILGMDRHHGSRAAEARGGGRNRGRADLDRGFGGIAEPRRHESVDVLPGDEGLPRHHEAEQDQHGPTQDAVRASVSGQSEPGDRGRGGQGRQGQQEPPHQQRRGLAGLTFGNRRVRDSDRGCVVRQPRDGHGALDTRSRLRGAVVHHEAKDIDDTGRRWKTSVRGVMPPRGDRPCKPRSAWPQA